MKCDELEKFDAASNADLSAGYDHRYAYEADEVDEAIAELKSKLESVQASAYADSVDAGMRERRLKRALWLARAERAYAEAKYNHQTARRYEEHKEHTIANCFDATVHKWQNVGRKCLKKAEEYK